MKLSRLITYLNKVKNNINMLSRNEHINKVWLYLDYIFAYIKHGCLINQYTKGHFYLNGEIIRSKAFTQRRLEKIIRISNDPNYVHYLINKNEFNIYFNEFIERSFLYSKTMTQSEFERIFNNNDAIFVKPIDAQEGEGIFKVDTNTCICSELYNDLKTKNVIIETIIKQHPKLMLGNASINSARVLTVLDKQGEAHIVRVGLRAGVGQSIVDNYSAGGVLYEVDTETGIIDHKGIQGDNYNIVFHPGTNTCMLGFQLPNYDILKKVVKKAHKSIPQCRFIGWDVAFTEHGIELIEGNHNPGIFTLESIGTPGAYFDVLNILNN